MTAAGPGPGRTTLRERLLPAGALLVVIAAAVVVALGALGSASVEPAASSFQRAVGGLGTGPTLDLTAGRSAFDPRLGSDPFGADRGLRTVGARQAADPRRDD